MLRKSIIIVVISCIICSGLAACSQQAPATVYDPNKQYAAYLVVNTPQASQALNSAQQKSALEGFVNGPVVYYEPGTQDFEEHFKKLTPSKQVSLIWVVGSLLDTPGIQKALTTSGYKGQFRYEPVTATSSKFEE